MDCIDSHAVNAGKRLVEGLDVTVAYEIPTERFGKFTLSGAWNHFFIWKAEPFDGQGTHNFLGDYNNGTFPLAPGGVPFNKAFVRGEWEWKGFDLVLTGNYVGDYEDDPSFILDNTITNPGSGNPEFAFHRRVSDYETLDMQLSYELKKPAAEPAPSYAKDSKDSKNVMSAQTDAASSTIWQRMLWNTKLTVGVNNAFDRNPPIVLGAFNDNYDTSNYSIRNPLLVCEHEQEVLSSESITSQRRVAEMPSAFCFQRMADASGLQIAWDDELAGRSGRGRVDLLKMGLSWSVYPSGKEPALW